MKIRYYALLLCAVLCSCGGAPTRKGEEHEKPAPTVNILGRLQEERRRLQEKVDELIKLLGSEEYSVRERAGRGILEIGSIALEKLNKAAKSEDLEVAVRAHRLSERIQVEATRSRVQFHNAITTGDLAAMRETIERDKNLLEFKPGGQTWLHKAAKAGQAEAARFLVELGIPIDATDSEGRTALHFATKGSVVRLLAGMGADMNSRDNAGRTALHTAIYLRNLEMCRALPSSGADVNAKDGAGDTPLDIARSINREDIAALLQSHGARAGSVCRSLVYAIKDGETKRMKHLLEQGGDVNAKDRDGASLLHHAVRAGRLEVVKFLMQKGASIEARDAGGSTLLHYVQDAETAAFLIEAGCKVNEQADSGETPLYAAVMASREELVKLLIEKGADVNAADNLGNTLLHVAARYGSYDAAGLLVAAGADVNAGNNLGDRPLDVTWVTYSEKMADMLRRCGATSYRDSLALLNAVEQGNRELAAEYLSRDVDINMKSAYGMAALHVAAARGDVVLVEMLMKAGADLNAPGPLDRTPLHEAVYRGYGKVARLLVEANAHVNQEDAFGDTPLDDADEDDGELVRFLREHGARKASELIKPEDDK